MSGAPPPPFAAVVLGAGRGVRLGDERPKGLVELGGRALVRWSVEALGAHPACAGVVVVAPPDRVAEFEAALGGIAPLLIVGGGVRRQDSARCGLEAAEFYRDAGADLVHDAARPFVPPDLVDRLLAALAAGADAAVPGLEPVETIKRVASGDGGDRVVETPPRGALRAVGTPQALRRPRAAAAFARLAAGERAFTDCASIIEADGGDVRVVAGDRRAFKITTAEDLAIAEIAVSAAGGGA